MEKIKAGIIGCGMIAETYHIPALLRCEGVEIIVLCDAVREKAAKSAEKFGIRSYTDCYEEVLDNPEIRAVFILTRVESHRKLALDAAKRGKHIFIQKPLAESAEEAKELIGLTESYHVKLTVSFMHRYFDECVLAREMLKTEDLRCAQQIQIFNCTQNPYDTAPLYGGCIMDIGSHGIDLITSLFGQKIVKATSLAFDPREREKMKISGILHSGERFATLLYELEDGRRIIHEINWSSASDVSRFRVRVEGKSSGLYLREMHLGGNIALAEIKDGNVTWSTPEFEETYPGVRQHQQFIDDIRYDQEYSTNAEEAYYVLKVVETAKRAVLSGKTEEIVL